MSEESNDGLPAGWESASLAALCQINPPLDRCVVNDAVEVNFVPMRAVEPEGAGLVRPEVRPYGDVKKGYTSFLSGDVIMAKITPCMENGKTTVVPPLPGSVCFGSTEFHVVRPETGALARWIAGYLVQHEVRRNAQRAMTGGVGQMRVPAAFLESLRIPIAPTAEQERVADALDELLSDLDAGVAALERVRDKLTLYRAAVLKAAVEGALTAEWRRQHPHAEPALELLKRILAERRRCWEEKQLRKFKEKGREPSKNWKAKYKEPVEPDTTGLPSLPEGWCWATVAQLAAPDDRSITDGPFGSNLKTEHYTASGPRVIRLQNVKDAVFADERAYISKEHFESLQRHQVFAGDIVIAALSDSPPRSCIIPASVGPAVVKADCIRFAPNAELSAPCINFFLNATPTRARTKKLVHGIGRPRLNLDAIRAIALPLPPDYEQQAIVEAVEGQLSVIDHLEADLGARLTSAQSLRQSILRHAFSGKLGSQDPMEEPASELLKRIVVEREQRAREAAAAKQLSGHKPRRAPKPNGKAAAAKKTKKETEHGRITNR